MAQYKVEICGVNTGKLPLLTEEEKQILFDKIKMGRPQCTRYVYPWKSPPRPEYYPAFYKHGENVDDLFQIGCIGLMKAVDNFDTTLQVKFSTYAVPMIIGEVRRYLRDNNSIRVSRSLRDIAYKAIYTKEALMKQSEKEPTLEEIAEKLNVAPEEIAMALDAIQSPVSLYEPVYSEGGDTLYIMDQISDTKNKEDGWVEMLSLREAIRSLPTREKNIIELRYFQGKTQIEVAQEIHISQAQVSRLEKNALGLMREELHE